MARNGCLRQTCRPRELIKMFAAATGSIERLRQRCTLGAQVLLRLAYQYGNTANDRIAPTTSRALEAAFNPRQRAAAMEATPGPGAVRTLLELGSHVDAERLPKFLIGMQLYPEHRHPEGDFIGRVD